MNKNKQSPWAESLRHVAFCFFVPALILLVGFAHGFSILAPRVQTDQKILVELKRFFERVDNDPITDSFRLGETVVYPVCRRDEKGNGTENFSVPWGLAGWGILVEDRGYAGPLSLLAAVAPDGHVIGIRLLQSRETLGFDRAFFRQTEFFGQFQNRQAPELFLTQEGGGIHAVSSATVTSRAVTSAARKVAGFFREKHETLIENLPPAVRESVLAGENFPPEGGADDGL